MKGTSQTLVSSAGISFVTVVRFLGSDSQVHLGWTAGVGGEYAFAPNWTARIEGRYSDFGNETYELIEDDPDTTSDESGDVEVDFDQFSVTGGISYLF